MLLHAAQPRERDALLPLPRAARPAAIEARPVGAADARRRGGRRPITVSSGEPAAAQLADEPPAAEPRVRGGYGIHLPDGGQYAIGRFWRRPTALARLRSPGGRIAPGADAHGGFCGGCVAPGLHGDSRE